MRPFDHIHIASNNALTCERLCVLFRIEHCHISFSLSPARWASFSAGTRPSLLVLATDFDTNGIIDIVQKAAKARVPMILVGDPLPARTLLQIARTGLLTDAIEPPLDDQDLLASASRMMIPGTLHGIGSPRSLEEMTAGLTRREHEVLDLIIFGASNKEAGRVMEISPRTVEVHRSRVMAKLEAKNTAELVRMVTAWRTAGPLN